VPHVRTFGVAFVLLPIFLGFLLFMIFYFRVVAYCGSDFAQAGFSKTSRSLLRDAIT